MSLVTARQFLQFFGIPISFNGGSDGNKTELATVLGIDSAFDEYPYKVKRRKLDFEQYTFQIHSCTDEGLKPHCLDCIKNKTAKKPISDCRFSKFRKYRGSEISYCNAETDANSCDKIKSVPMSWGEPSMDEETANYIIKYMKSYFLEICQSELDAIAELPLPPSWRRREDGVKEQCDACRSTIFNLHWFCEQCCFMACRECFEGDFKGKVLPHFKKCDKANFHACTLIPTQYLKEFYEIVGVGDEGEQAEDQRQEELPDGYTLRSFNGPSCFKSKSSLNLCNREPFVLSNVKLSDKWTLQKLCLELGDLPVTLTECWYQVPLKKKRSLSKYIRSFRSNLAKTELDLAPYAICKLSDFPQDDAFENVLPRHYQDFIESLPIKDLCSPEGKLNLLSHLPQTFVKPDLVKGYFAHGSGLNNAASTCLHLDVSDAFNVAVLVEKAEEEDGKAIRKYIQQCPFIDKHFKERAKYETPGAIWHVFHPDDRAKIEEYLRKKNKCRSQTPIHDQLFYLDDAMLKELKKLHGVQPYTIVQFANDAVGVSAGFPHQVRNLHSCFKMALDYVNCCNLDMSLKLDSEFRHLPTSHKNQEDKLQLKNVIYQTMLKAYNSI